MQTGKSIVNLPLLIGGVLSVAIHAVALYRQGIYTPPEPKMESGQTVVQLTLIPSAASQAVTPDPTPPEPAEEPREEQKPEPVEPAPVEPAPAPIPQPVVEPTPEPKKETVPEPEPQETAEVNSIEQNATLVEDKGVITEAVATTSIQPNYPRVSQRRNEEGNVSLLVHILASGKPDHVQVVGSSGYKRLDEAAVKAVQKATFEPAREFGQTVDSETKITISFKLTDD